MQLGKYILVQFYGTVLALWEENMENYTVILV